MKQSPKVRKQTKSSASRRRHHGAAAARPQADKPVQKPLSTIPTEPKPGIPGAIAEAVKGMIKTARGFTAEAGQVDPEWNDTRRHLHLEAAYANLSNARVALSPYGGDLAAKLGEDIAAAMKDRIDTVHKFREPVTVKIPGRAPRYAKFFAEVRAFAAQRRHIRVNVGDDDALTICAILDALNLISRSLDDMDRCILAGKPALLKRVHLGVEVRAGDEARRV
jgi:hypothetical protein